MEALIVVLGLLFVLFIAAGAFVTVKAVSAAKRSVERTVAQARRTVEDTTLRAKQYAQPGTAGELAQMRLSLRTSMRSTQEALRAATPEDPSLSEALDLFGRLSVHGHALDDELKRLEREPNRDRITENLPELRERLERITHSAESLRWAARDRARKFADDDLVVLGQQIDVEAGALRHWTTTSQDGGPEPVGDPLDQWADATREPGAAGAPGERPAVTARDPRVETTYPWQKHPWQKERSTRPEGTS